MKKNEELIQRIKELEHQSEVAREEFKKEIKAQSDLYEQQLQFFKQHIWQ